MIRSVLSPTFLGLGIGLCLCFGSAHGQEGSTSAEEQAQIKKLEALDRQFVERFTQVEREHIQALDQLAKDSSGLAAELTYQRLLRMAIQSNLYSEAEPAAERVIQDQIGAPELQYVARLVNVVAEADQGKYEESLATLKSYIEEFNQGVDRPTPLDTTALQSLLDAYFTRLVRGGQYSIAQQVCGLVCENAQDPQIVATFEARQGQFALLGEQAPQLEGQTIEGQAVGLEQDTDRVTLVYFWATWCPPCNIEAIQLNGLADLLADRPFRILGVNVDLLTRGGDDPETIRQDIRRFLIEKQVNWQSLVLEDDAVLEQFAIRELPSNFLIDSQGVVRGINLDETTGLDTIEELTEMKDAN